MYKFTLCVLLRCVADSVCVSLENPNTSYLWAILEMYAGQKGIPWPPKELSCLAFHACCHGSRRPKRTKILGAHHVFDLLQADCPGDSVHTHAPWGLEFLRLRHPQGGGLSWPSAARVAACVCKHLQNAGVAFSSSDASKLQASSLLGLQSRKHKPLIPEYKSVQWLPRSEVPAEGAKILLSLASGDGREKAERAEAQGVGVSPQPPLTFAPDPDKPPLILDPKPCPNTENSHSGDDEKALPHEDPSEVKVGFWFSMAEHVREAKKLQHPMDANNPLPDCVRRAIAKNFEESPEKMKVLRTLAVLKTKLLVKQLSQEENALRRSFDTDFEKVMGSKKILALERLLVQEGYDDLGVITILKEGVRLVGVGPKPECFDAKVKHATMTEEELRWTAKMRRRSMMEMDKRVDPKHVDPLMRATQEEVDLNFLDGPYSEQGISKLLGHDQWAIVRRFVLIQGAEMKLRPIDDATECQLNSAYTATIKLDLQGSDFTAALALEIARQANGSEHWLGKCLDLTNPPRRDLSKIYFRTPAGEDLFYLCRALMFGASGSVFDFTRVSRCLWFLINRLLWIPSGHYFDDFPCFCPSSTAAEADEALTEFLDTLGWAHAKTGAKGKAFASGFPVLGMRLDLGAFCCGEIVMANKPGRVERISELLNEVSTKNHCSRHEAQVLAGLLNYASGFYAGRSLRHSCSSLHCVASGMPFSPEATRDLCSSVRSILEASKPRILRINAPKEVIHVYTDGCWEKGFAGVGAVVMDMLSDECWVFEGEVPSPVLEAWKHQVGDQIITQIELYILLLIRVHFSARMVNRRCIFHIDNEAARLVAIKGASRSESMHIMAGMLSDLEAQWPCHFWAERVPSFSNIADPPSKPLSAQFLFCSGGGVGSVQVPRVFVGALPARSRRRSCFVGGAP